MDLVAAHPATGCGNDNNGEGQEATCKKVTGENPSRQLASVHGRELRAKRIAEVLVFASSLYNEDREDLYHPILDFDDPQVMGDE
jgi:hypothetical protein